MLFLPENLGSVSSLEGSRTCSSTQICNTQGTIYREKVTAEQVPDLQFFWLTFGFKESITLFFIVYQESHTVKVCCLSWRLQYCLKGKVIPLQKTQGSGPLKEASEAGGRNVPQKLLNASLRKEGENNSILKVELIFITDDSTLIRIEYLEMYNNIKGTLVHTHTQLQLMNSISWVWISTNDKQDLSPNLNIKPEGLFISIYSPHFFIVETRILSPHPPASVPPRDPRWNTVASTPRAQQPGLRRLAERSCRLSRTQLSWSHSTVPLQLSACSNQDCRGWPKFMLTKPGTKSDV